MKHCFFVEVKMKKYFFWFNQKYEKYQMIVKNISQEFRLKNIDEIRNYFLEEIGKNELMSKRRRIVCTTLSYNEYFLILASAITECIPISDFASMLGISLGIMSSAIGIKTFAVAVGTKNYQAIIKKQKKNMIK